MCTSGTAVANLHPAVLEAAHAGVTAGRGHRRPAGPAARHRRQPDHRPGRHLRTASSATVDVTTGAYPELAHATRCDPGHRSERSVHLNVQLDDPLVADRTGWAPDVDARPVASTGAGPRPMPLATDPARACGPSSSPGTTPGRRPGCWPSARAGRCSPSPPAARAPATHAIRTATGCCSTDRLAAEVERVVVFGHPTLSRPVQPAARPRRRRGLERRRAGVWSVVRSRSTSDFVDLDVEASLDDTEWLDRWRDGRRRGEPRPRRAARRRAGPDAVRRRGCRRAGAPARGPAGRRRLQPDPRPRPDGAALRGRRPPEGGRQPRAVRHRRRRLHGGRCRARPAVGPEPRAGRRRDVPARRERPGPRARRAAARPDDRGRQRRRRLDLRDARAGRASSTPTATSGSSAPRTASTWRASARPRAPPTPGAEPSRARAGAGQPNGGIEVVEAVCAATTGAPSTRGSGRSRQVTDRHGFATSVPRWHSAGHRFVHERTSVHGHAHGRHRRSSAGCSSSNHRAVEQDPDNLGPPVPAGDLGVRAGPPCTTRPRATTACSR